MFGIVPETLALWYTRGRIRCGKWVKGPGGRRCKIYPVEELERVMEEMAASRPRVPDGFVTREEACRRLGISMATWVNWQREGRIRCARWGRSPSNKPCKLYAVEDVRRLMEEMRGADKVYREASGQYRIPDGFVRRRDACRMFGVDPNTWSRWEREGLITCGRRCGGGRINVYPKEELQRLLVECGRYVPPYPDPDRPGCYRVPLAGQDMRRREAIIDAEDLPLVGARRWHYSKYEAEHLGQVQTFNPGGTTRLRQLIMGISGTEMRVGHLNGDPLDCRRANLVVRTASESGAAMRKAKAFRGQPCSSRFKGVCWDRRREKWSAYIKKDRVMRNLGQFRDEIAAAQAYDEAARELFGEHARVNFPDGIDAALARPAA